MSASVAVYLAKPIDPATRPDLVALLDDHERERMAAFRRDDDRARYLAAHALVRIVVADRISADRISADGIPDDRTTAAALVLDRTCRCGKPHGKPRVAGGGPEFSLTHSGQLVGVAVSDEPVGLDVEQHRPLSALDGLAEHVLSRAELAAGVPAPADFLVTWTRKEALLKATGEGLSSPMDAITLSAPDASGPRVQAWDGVDGDWWVADVDTGLDDHPAAVAGAGRVTPEIRIGDGTAILSGVRATLER
ncbi:4'-phosphopantetheinyl transferase family protein [Pseudonocardia phyllosphaerae]|uniref:4'-phosphopantetheinyl transferase family protein n=1 Tax=Pseudonocardia phyllosphaerae TaxID=3390502 RepID=UPI003979B4AE